MQNNIDFWIRKWKFSASNYQRIMQSNFHTPRAVDVVAVFMLPVQTWASTFFFISSQSTDPIEAFCAFAVRSSGCLFVWSFSFQFSLLRTRFNGSLKLISRVPSHHISHIFTFHSSLFVLSCFFCFWWKIFCDKHQTIIFCATFFRLMLLIMVVVDSVLFTFVLNRYILLSMQNYKRQWKSDVFGSFECRVIDCVAYRRLDKRACDCFTKCWKIGLVCVMYIVPCNALVGAKRSIFP